MAGTLWPRIWWYTFSARAQHAFIDPTDPECPYKNSITIIESNYNKRCFNDGYHIGHHLFPGMHWSEMPSELEKNKNYYKNNGGMIFRKLDYQMVWLMLMLKRFKYLARYFVLPENETMSLDQIAKMIQSKLKPISITGEKNEDR